MPCARLPPDENYGAPRRNRTADPIITNDKDSGFRWFPRVAPRCELIIFLSLKIFTPYVDCSEWRELAPACYPGVTLGQQGRRKPMRRRPVARITKRYVDALKASAADVVHWDDALPGFGVGRRAAPSPMCSSIA